VVPRPRLICSALTNQLVSQRSGCVRVQLSGSPESADWTVTALLDDQLSIPGEGNRDFTADKTPDRIADEQGSPSLSQPGIRRFAEKCFEVAARRQKCGINLEVSCHLAHPRRDECNGRAEVAIEGNAHDDIRRRGVRSIKGASHHVKQLDDDVVAKTTVEPPNLLEVASVLRWALGDPQHGDIRDDVTDRDIEFRGTTLSPSCDRLRD